MKTFKEFLSEYINKNDYPTNIDIIEPDKMNYYNLINEGVIYPINIKIPLDYDIEDLNKRFDNITFYLNSSSSYKDDKIKIGVLNDGKRYSARELESIISHEMIHAVQDERSNSKFINWKNSIEKEINKLLSLSDKELITKELIVRDLMFKIKKDNPYEKMAYAYQLVFMLKQSKSLKQIINIAKEHFNLYDRVFLKYIGIYYQGITKEIK